MPTEFQRPKGRILIYWGCGEHAGPGQPTVIDFATMKPGQVPPVEELRNPKERLMFRPVIGAPDTVAATLNRVFGRVPGTHLAMGMLPGMPPERSRRFIDRLVQEVVPQLD